MEQDLVEKRRWFSKQDYLEGLTLAQLAPGPLAAQLAIYLGWVRGRVLGHHAIADIPTILICLMALGIILRFKWIPDPLVIVLAGLAGLAIRG